jgi:hypothetical protein
MDRRNNLHAAAAAIAFENVDGENPSHKLSPGVIARTAFGFILLLLIWIHDLNFGCAAGNG